MSDSNNPSIIHSSSSVLDRLDLSAVTKIAGGIDQAIIKNMLKSALWDWFDSNKARVIWTAHFRVFSLDLNHGVTVGDLRIVFENIVGTRESILSGIT